MHFEALSTKYVNFNHFGWFFENFVTKFLFFWQFFLSFLVWEIILLSKNLSILGIFHLSYTQREIKKSFFKQVQLASLQVELGKANSNKASFRQIDLNLRATLVCILSQNTSKETKIAWLSTWFYSKAKKLYHNACNLKGKVFCMPKAWKWIFLTF